MHPAIKYFIATSLKLTENERAVLASLETQKMCQTTARIARNAKVPRTTADHILRKFLDWKVVKQVDTGRKKKWLYRRL